MKQIAVTINAAETTGETLKGLLEHAKDDIRLAEITASREGLWNLAEACRIAHGKIVETFLHLK